MSAATPQATDAATVPSSLPGGPHPRRRRHWWVFGAAAIVVAAGAVLAVVDPFGGTGASNGGVADNAAATSLTTVAHRSLSAQTNVSATLGYAGTYDVVNQAHGTITALPAVGQVVSQGQVLYQVSGGPVVLLYGSVPAYRSLSEGASPADVSGPDVQQLNADLVALGYATSSELDPNSDEFGWWTKEALEKLQAHLGVTQDGTLALGQAVFLPTAARVTQVPATLGAEAQPGPVLTATSTTRQVTIALDASQQSEVKVGDKVSITLPNNQTTPGVVSAVGTVATSSSGGGGSGSPTITVQVTPTDPTATGSLDQAPVQVSITTATVNDALVVPVDALLALSGGGYAVEVVSSDGVHHLVPVTLGLFDDADGLVQVSGQGLAAGQRVVVPAT